MPLHVVEKRTLEPRTEWIQGFRSQRTPDVIRIDSAVIASFALRLRKRCCSDCSLQSLARWSGTSLPVPLRMPSAAAAAAVATAGCVSSCFHPVPTPLSCSSLWISHSALLELCSRVSRSSCFLSFEDTGDVVSSAAASVA